MSQLVLCKICGKREALCPKGCDQLNDHVCAPCYRENQVKLDRCETCKQPLGALMVHADGVHMTRPITRAERIILEKADALLEGQLKLHFSRREICEDSPDGCSTCDPSCEDCRKKLFGIYAKRFKGGDSS